MRKILLAALFLTACTTAQIAQFEQGTPSGTIAVPTATYNVSLGWEKNHPERKAWSQALFKIIEPDVVAFASAKDITKFRPDFAKLSKTQRVEAIAEIFSADSLYESNWNPASADVDVGEQDDQDSWSLGLMQMSVCDQTNYHLTFGFKVADLKQAVPNLKLAEAVLVQQIKRHGTILMPAGSSVYWSTMEPGGKYDKSAKIIADVQALKL